MRRDFLKELEVTDEAIEKIMAEYGKSIEGLKAQIESKGNVESELSATQAQLEKLQADIKAFEGSEGTIEELKAQIKAKDDDYQQFKADTEKREIVRSKTAALSKALETAGAVKSSIDLLIPTFDIENMQVDKSGNIVDLDDLINPVKETRKELFVTTRAVDDPPTKGRSTTEYDNDQDFFNAAMKKG